MLLVPREHVVTLPDLPAALRDPFLAAAQRLATAMVEALGAQGSFVAMNNTVSPVGRRTCTCTSYPAPRATGCAASSGRAPRTPTGEAGEYAGRLRAVLGGDAEFTGRRDRAAGNASLTG